MNDDKNTFIIGYDLLFLHQYGLKIPITAPVGHSIIVGSSGSGKSSAILYYLYKMKKLPLEIWIIDFKASHEFQGIVPDERYAEFEASYDKICQFHEMFIKLPEGGDKNIKILIIDEVAGLLNFFSMNKEGKSKADRIRLIMADVLMMGRSRRCFLWLAMQRYSASIFPSGSGAADNFHMCLGLGRLSVDGRKGLFAGEHFPDEEDILFGQAKGIVLVEGQPLQAIILPYMSKEKLLSYLQEYH